MPPTHKPGEVATIDARPSDETTPLLTSVEPTPIAESSPTPDQLLNNDEDSIEGDEEDNEEEIPLPKTQIFLLCYTAVVEPIAFFGIFPYMTFMIEKVGNVKPDEVGFYSGLIESLFSATQMCVMIYWGKVCVTSLIGNIKLNFCRLLIDTEGSQHWSSLWSESPSQ
jgi:hypothetical protein